MRSRCDSQRVTFDLESFALGIEAKAAIWTTRSMGLSTERQLASSVPCPAIAARTPAQAVKKGRGPTAHLPLFRCSDQPV